MAGRGTTTLATLRHRVLDRLGDLPEQVWTAAEVERYVRESYRLLAQTLPIFFDISYLDNLPATFSHTARWEVVGGYGTFRLGVANYTCADEARVLTEPKRVGPATVTCPTDGSMASTVSIPATRPVPADLTALDRATWDSRTLDADLPRHVRQLDSRYTLTRGQPLSLLMQHDGVQTARQWPAPAALAATVTTAGSWGLLRTPADLSADTVTGSWGIARRVPGQHPMGPEAFGAPRQPHLDGTNTRIEFFRHGRALAHADSVCELPDRYARYLCDYAQARALERAGPGQDLTLAAHFDDRWQRNVARLRRRVITVTKERTGVFGGTAARGGAVRYPRLPANYGRVMR